MGVTDCRRKIHAGYTAEYIFRTASWVYAVSRIHIYIPIYSDPGYIHLDVYSYTVFRTYIYNTTGIYVTIQVITMYCDNRLSSIPKNRREAVTVSRRDASRDACGGDPVKS